MTCSSTFSDLLRSTSSICLLQAESTNVPAEPLSIYLFVLKYCLFGYQPVLACVQSGSGELWALDTLNCHHDNTERLSKGILATQKDKLVSPVSITTGMQPGWARLTSQSSSWHFLPIQTLTDTAADEGFVAAVEADHCRPWDCSCLFVVDHQLGVQAEASTISPCNKWNKWKNGNQCKTPFVINVINGNKWSKSVNCNKWCNKWK